MAYLTPRGDTRSVGSSSKVDTAWSRLDCPLTWSPSDGLWLTVDRAIGTTQTYLDLHLTADLHRGTIAIFINRTASCGLSLQSRSDGLEGARKNSMITIGSNRYRGAIELWSWILHRGIDSTIFRRRSRWIAIMIKPRLWPDRGAIVAYFEANLRKNSPQIRELWSHQKELLPRPLKTASTTASNGLNSGAKFPFKKPCILHLFFNFWSIREGN